MSSKSAESFFKSESSYRMLVENSCDIIFSLDMKGNFTYISPAWKKILGHEPSEIIGHNFREFIHQDDHAGCEEIIAKAVKTGEAAEYTYRIRSVDGSWRWHLSRGAPHRDEKGVMTIIGIAYDVTDRLRIEELISRNEKMVMISSMAAGMAHEINNPLGAILQHAQNIERRVSQDLPANQKAAAEVGVNLDLVHAYLEKRAVFDFIRHIRTAGIRASNIISNMLQFSRRNESGAELVTVSDLLDRVVELAGTDYEMKKKYDFRSITLHREYEANLPQVLISVSEMEQVLLNILKNAAQSLNTPEMKHNSQITLRTRSGDGLVVIEIEDNGPGMDETVRLRAFEPFFTTRDVGSGAGLGLSVAYSIVTKGHHGTIEVRTHPGEGSCFTIRLPLQGRA